VSRLARNTVDFLTSIRKLKALGIEVIFVNYDQTSSQSSEFMLTMLSAIAQEESSNTSKRVKFGKKQNAMKGRVPNFIYGYDKVSGDYFNLTINELEANVIKRVFRMYTKEGYGTNRIAKNLNNEGILTKRECKWTQNGVIRLLSNEIYIGNIINGKEEINDFLTGKRTAKNRNEWYITKREDLRIIENEEFLQAKKLLLERKYSFHQGDEREVDTYIFSKLIYCGDCGSVFRRIVRTYKNIYIKWVCTRRNGIGVQACPNTSTMDENVLLDKICEYLYIILTENGYNQNSFMKEINKQLMQYQYISSCPKDYEQELQKSRKKKDKYIMLYSNDIITMDELKFEVQKIQEETTYYEQKLSSQNGEGKYSDVLKSNEIILQEIRDKMEKDNYWMKEYLTNRILKKIIEKIIVERQDRVIVYLNHIE
jgi:site-specific DNA recombinase